MRIEVKCPAFSESITEGRLLPWSKRVGEAVSRGDVLVGVETDKVVLDVNAQQDGVLVEIVKPEGEVVQAGDLIAVIDTAASPAAPAAASAPAAAVASTPAPVAGAAAGEAILSPAVRKLVAETGVSPEAIAGSGKDGRLTKGDVLGHLEGAAAAAPAPAPAAVAPPAPAPVAASAVVTPTVTVAAGERVTRRVPMTRIRTRIAERLKQVQNTAAILTTFNEINMQAVMDLRKKHQDAFVKRHGIKLGFMSFFVAAVTEALKQYPVINASVEGHDIAYHGFFDIGIAVASERGLVVPVLRNTDTLSLAEIEKAIAGYAEKARGNKLTLEDLSGGTFTITNGGTFGSLLSTPILNAPQSGILGMHNIVERPVAENGQVVVRPMMYVALSYDHRIIDGKEAVLFLVTLKNLLEDPSRMLLGI
ncbi:MAG: 2-oxoglutarate dehydrogenase complex dihydrolipoyllysine-residue succinyltransferase [bacterium]|nr:2-oxoglutarate dehydrogenase complex dihydrolipoyllysine-residue succinyltransferase [bacterium]